MKRTNSHKIIPSASAGARSAAPKTLDGYKSGDDTRLRIQLRLPVKRPGGSAPGKTYRLRLRIQPGALLIDRTQSVFPTSAIENMVNDILQWQNHNPAFQQAFYFSSEEGERTIPVAVANLREAENSPGHRSRHRGRLRCEQRHVHTTLDIRTH